MLKRLLIVFYLAIITAPVLRMFVAGWPEQRLAGVSEPVVKPVFGLRTFAHEAYQKRYVAWFERNYGFRATAVRLDSSIDYYVFAEAPADSRVRVGAHGILFVDEDIDYFNRPTLVPPKEIVDATTVIGRVQTKLAERGRALVIVITPSKTSLYPEEVPASWRRNLPSPRPSDALYEAFVRELRRTNVRFVDARALLAAKQATGGEAWRFPRVGRHWNELEACSTLHAALAVGRALAPQSALADNDCEGARLARPMPMDEEVDLWRLLNVWGPTPDDLVPRLPAVPHTDAELPTALFVGSSFSWKLIFQSERSHLFRSIVFYYYNRTVIDRALPPSTTYPVDATSDAWRSLTLSRDLYVVELPEWYLPGANADFFAQIDAALPR